MQKTLKGLYTHLLKDSYIKKDYESVVSKIRLSNGKVWPVPNILDINKSKYKEIKNHKNILLTNKKREPIAQLNNISFFTYNKYLLLTSIFGTNDIRHSGFEDIYKMEDYLVGGNIQLIDESKDIFSEHNYTPFEAKEYFKNKNWKKIAAFQTRNVPHRGHEFLQKETLEKVDGLFIQPIIGEKKLKDFKDEYIIASYEALIEKYSPKNKVPLGILPLKMRYAGPKEAIFHALIRRNFGCTHFIVGRDHARVGNYYPAFAAQEIFDKFSKKEIWIKIIKFPEVVYCKSKKTHTFISDCPEEKRIYFSGTKLRDLIKSKKHAPEYIVRKDMVNILKNSNNSLVDKMYKNNKREKGFVLWFTGLSSSGKTSVADSIFNILKKNKINTERLDGDIVRQTLTKGLGFSKKDRDENIRRVGFVANLLSKNNIAVIASFISPYKKQRQELRKKVHNYIEVFVNTPLSVSENRDKKGLYKKARDGIIKQFTGISDPYETPEKS